MDRWRASPAAGRDARLRLVNQLLVASAELHTESGYHTALVRPWHTSAVATRFAKSASRLNYEEACRTLWEAAARSAVVVPEREARRWFPFGDAGLGDLIDAGRIQRLTAARRTWLIGQE
jgi:hypothetical protein